MPTSTGRVVVVGQGRIGLPLALRAVSAGFDVVGCDARVSRVRRIVEGDPGLTGIPVAALRDAQRSGRYRVTSAAAECAGFDVAVITVPTPWRSGAPDTMIIDSAAVESAAGVLAPSVTAGSLVILEATVYPGTTEQLLIPALELVSGLEAGRDFSVGYVPERIDPAVASAMPPRVVAGIDERSAERTSAFYRALSDDTITVADIRVAELAKLAEVTLLHGNSAMVGWLNLFAAEMGVDLWSIVDAALGDIRPDPDAGSGASPESSRRGPGAGSSADLAQRLNPSRAVAELRAVSDLPRPASGAGISCAL